VSSFLDELKSRQMDAHRKFQISQQKLQQAQSEHQAIVVELTSWQNAVAAETRREQQESAASDASAVAGTDRPTLTTQPTDQSESNHQEINKTGVIRDALRQHPAGIRPVELWKELKGQIDRGYLYSVLKRLKDRKQVTEKRGKYYPQIISKTEESAKEQSQIVQ
jgi:hypothetical protein